MHILTADVEGPEAMGAQSEWLSYSSPTEEHEDGWTLIFIGRTSSPGQLTWFVRNDPIAAVSPSPAFAESFIVEPGSLLHLHHRVMIVDRVLARAKIGAFAKRSNVHGEAGE